MESIDKFKMLIMQILLIRALKGRRVLTNSNVVMQILKTRALKGAKRSGKSWIHVAGEYWMIIVKATKIGKTTDKLFLYILVINCPMYLSTYEKRF